MLAWTRDRPVPVTRSERMNCAAKTRGKVDDRPFVLGVHRFDRRRCDYCGRWIGINVRAQHYRAKHYHKPVTDPDLDAPDGAVVDGFERVGDRWEPVRRPAQALPKK